jgi:EF-P beta-lysylation protein EpmB
MAAAVTDPARLLECLELPATLLPGAMAAARRFGLRVPPAYLALIRPGDPDDPLLRQILPRQAELEAVPGFVADPVGDLRAARGDGILHKYQGRALLLATPACAVHCRYCFRRAFPYAAHRPEAGTWQAAMDRLAADPGLREVILSGGDPLSLDDSRLARLVDAIGAIPQVRCLRLHTRLPVVIPGRITPSLIRLLGASRLRCVVVLHVNHPRELSAALRAGLERLRPVALLLNQSVLLRGVNDAAATLVELSEALFDSEVLPYYIHLLDRVDGAAHFAVPPVAARALIQQVRARLPGYLVPRLVREKAGAPAKLPLE